MGQDDASGPHGATKPDPRSTFNNERNHLEIWLLLSFFFLFLLTSTGRVRTIDEVLPLFQAESFVHHGNFAVPQAVSGNLFIGKYDLHGHPQAPYPPGFAIAIIPAYLTGEFFAGHITGVPSPSRELFTDFFAVGSNALFSVVALTLAFATFRRIGISSKVALSATVLIGLGTPLLGYSAWFFSEPLSSALLLGAALALFGVPKEQSLTFVRLTAGGALLGAAVWVRPTHILATPVFLLAMLVRDWKTGLRAAAIVGGVVSVFVAAYLARNTALFGNPLDFGYARSVEAGKQMNSFETPLTVGLYGFLFSPGKSAFLFAPPLLLAVSGLRRLWICNRGLATVALLTPISYLFFYSRFSQWEGNYCFGPRYMVPVIGLACLGLGPRLFQSTVRVRRIAILLGVAGLLVQGIGLSTSFLEDEATNHYYDSNLNYRLGYSPLISQTKLLIHYLGHPAAPLGRGFDRWFLFLSKARVSEAVVGTILAIECFGLLLAVWALRRSMVLDQQDSSLSN